MSIKDEVLTGLKEKLALSSIDENSRLQDLGIDSLDIVELVMALEEEFDMEIPDSDAEKVVTVGDVVEYIKENVQ